VSALPNREEMTMTQNNPKDAGQGKAAPRHSSRFLHWARVVVMFLSGGFIFPHAMTEDMDTDIAKPGATQDVKAEKL